LLELQINARTLKTVAVLLLLQGETKESLELLAALYQHGNMLSGDGWLIERLIGIAIRLIANSGLELAILNACETTEDLDYALDLFDRIARSATHEPENSLLKEELGAPRMYMESVGGRTSMNFLEAQIRYKVSNMQFEVTRMALAAKRHFFEHGRYPASADGYRPYLSDGIPQDWFGNPPGPVRFTSPDEDPYITYSLGPDDKDDGGLLKYSPTNGTKSDGDLLVEVSSKRKYPFPREGIDGLDAEDLLALFPEGLPTDGFRGSGAEPLSIMEATGENPLTVFGFGPSGTLGTSVTGVRMYEIPGMFPKLVSATETVDTGASHPSIQFVFSSQDDAPLSEIEKAQNQRWEALSQEEREIVQNHRQSSIGGMGGYGLGPAPATVASATETAEDLAERQARMMQLMQQMQSEGKLDLSLYPSPGEKPGPLILVPYDPTNGIKSDGQIFLRTRD
jgi:hypothetical protein